MYGDVGGGARFQNSTHATRTRVVIKMKMFAFQNRYFDFLSLVNKKKVHRRYLHHAILQRARTKTRWSRKTVATDVVRQRFADLQQAGRPLQISKKISGACSQRDNRLSVDL